ncbi:uncharacterized protein TNCT_500901 [Trichonephila clavata]|uniref:Uncharacterized protein n=1 Tax=Trichonephila clavata TaxID=2740835 RepID=A0A8X6HWR3_TRICU|nr:uncharacterized protein TNCT_500901 [Trichonephila clavata]
MLPCQKQHQMQFHLKQNSSLNPQDIHSTIQQAQLDAIIEKFTDVFYSNDDNIGLCPYVKFKIELQHERPIRCRPYRLSEPDRQFLKTQIQKWFKQGICHHSNSPYAAPAFIVFQDGARPDPERIAAIERYLTLRSIQEVRGFLGFANQSWKYIRNYAVAAKPLTNVLKKKTSNTPIVLTDDQQRTFEHLKTAITTALTLFRISNKDYQSL